MFNTYLQLGLEHILDINGYDHILFIIALCAGYAIGHWKQLIYLVTAFTVGHCLTLVLSALDIVRVNAELVEFLIPVTIIITALYNLYAVSKEHHISIKWHYAITLFFGLIHGLGFSNFFKSLLGQEESIVKPLLAFNIGVEIGQLFIVLAIVAISMICARLWHVTSRSWSIFLSGIAFGVAVTLLM